MSLETITIKLDDYNKMKKENEELKDLCWETQQQLNEESQERLKNKECWMSVKELIQTRSNLNCLMLRNGLNYLVIQINTFIVI